MKILIAGDIHGRFDLLEEAQRNNPDCDLCLQVGDLEPVRGEDDLKELTGPDRYNKVRQFPDYWASKKTLPIETWFIGGNHEPWSLLYQHNQRHGNDPELIDNLYYFGRYGVRDINGLTIAGLSGVYGEKSYDTPSSDRLRWALGKDWFKNRRTAHFREDEVEALLEEATGRDVDILMTHCWPTPDVLEEAPGWYYSNGYGIGVIGDLAELIEPTYHVAGHIHRAFEADYRDAKARFIACAQAGTEYRAFKNIEVQPNETDSYR